MKLFKNFLSIFYKLSKLDKLIYFLIFTTKNILTILVFIRKLTITSIFIFISPNYNIKTPKNNQTLYKFLFLSFE